MLGEHGELELDLQVQQADANPTHSCAALSASDHALGEEDEQELDLQVWQANAKLILRCEALSSS